MANGTLYLERIDPTRNMARFYAVDLQTDLFGEVVAQRRWGRIGTRGQTASQVCRSVIEGQVALDICVRTKRKRGYSEKVSQFPDRIFPGTAGVDTMPRLRCHVAATA